MKTQKIANILRREVLWFFLGIGFAILQFGSFQVGDWLSKNILWFDLCYIIIFVLIALFSGRSAKQH